MRTTTVCQAANVELSFTLIADDDSARAKGATEKIARITQHASAEKHPLLRHWHRPHHPHQAAPQARTPVAAVPACEG